MLEFQASAGIFEVSSKKNSKLSCPFPKGTHDGR